jgi:hypothetical protein
MPGIKHGNGQYVVWNTAGILMIKQQLNCPFRNVRGNLVEKNYTEIGRATAKSQPGQEPAKLKER